MKAPLGDQAIACLKQTLTDTQKTSFAVAIAEAELEHGTQGAHEMRAAIALGVLSGLGVTAEAVARATKLLQRPTLTIVH